MAPDLARLSRFLSLVLRHRPCRIGLVLDAQGWASVNDLIARAVAHGHQLDWETLTLIVATSDKRRFALSADGSRIRANQGHSVAVDLGLPPAVPPPCLYHGTALRNLPSIRASGLHAARRRHVHLSPDAGTAMAVGARHGEPVVLVVAAGDMHAAGHVFMCAPNGVWLTDAVPARFIGLSPANGQQ